MSKRDELVTALENARTKMIAHLNEIDKNRKIYPLWTIREILAHLSGWDDATIAYLRALQAGTQPPTPAARGIEPYNQESVATRQGLDYDHVRREYLETRRVLLDLIRQLPEELVTKTETLPWGDQGTLVDIVNIWCPHEEEHAEDVHKLMQESQ